MKQAHSFSKSTLEAKIANLWQNIDVETKLAPTARDAEKIGEMMREVNTLEQVFNDLYN